MKALLFSDPHITTKAEFSTPTPDGLTTYLHRCIKTFEWIISIADERRPDAIICGGDVTETTGYVDSTSLKVAVDLFERLSDLGIPVYVLVGNHDCFSTEHNIHNLEFLRPLKSVEIIDRPGTYHCDQFYFLPWVKNLDEELGIPDSCLFAVTHIDVEGGYLFKKKKADFGVDPSSFKLPVFNGHQHNPCQVSPNFINIGAVLSRNFHDVDSDPRGALIVNVKDGMVGYERVNNPHDIPFRDILILDDEDAYDWKDLDTDLSNTFVRVRYAPEHKELAELVASLAVNARTELRSLERKVSDSTEKATEPFKFEDILKDYFKGSMYCDELVELGLKYLEKVKVSEVRHTLPVNLNWVNIENFQSIGYMTLDLSKGGLWFVSGDNEDDAYISNGVGKSSIPESIYWCLTGKSLRKYRGDDVIHWDKDYCRVELSITVQGDSYVLTRSRKDPELGTGLRVSKVDENSDLQDISCRLPSDTQDLLDSIVGRSSKVLQHSVFLTAGLSTRFTSLSYSDRIRLIEEICDLDTYASAYKLADKALRQSREDLQYRKGQSDLLRKRVADLKVDLEDAEVRLSEASDSIKESLRELKSSLKTVSSQISEMDKSVGSTDYLADPPRENPKLSTLRGKIADARVEKSRLQSYVDNHLSTISRYEDLINKDLCPECGQATSNAELPRATIAEMNEKISKCKKDQELLIQKINSYELLQSKLKLADENKREEFSKDTAKAREIQKSLQHLRVRENSLKNEIVKARSMTKDLQSRVTDISSQLEKAETELKEINSTLGDLDFNYDCLSAVVEAFAPTGIRSTLLFQHALPYFNQKLVEYSTALGQPCMLDYKKNKKGDLEEKIEPRFEGDRTYNGASRGEKMMVDLAIQLAFNDLSIASGGAGVNVLFCDEVIDHIDEPTTKSFIDLLTEKAQDRTIFLMAHQKHIDSMVTNSIRLVKKDRVTQLVES